MLVGDALTHFRYEECKTKLTPFLKKVGFNPKTGVYNIQQDQTLRTHKIVISSNFLAHPTLDMMFIPVSGLTGTNIRDVAPEEVCPWYR